MRLLLDSPMRYKCSPERSMVGIGVPNPPLVDGWVCSRKGYKKYAVSQASVVASSLPPLSDISYQALASSAHARYP